MKQIVFIIFLFPFLLFSQEEKKIALIIGNAEYGDNPSAWLKNPVNDANLIAATLESIGFEILLYENLKTRSEINGAFRSFGEKLKDYDISFTYYAGHGIQIDGYNYLIPTESNPQDEFDVKDNTIPIDNLIRWLNKKTEKQQTHILVLDACRDNPFESRWSRAIKGNGLAKIDNIGSGLLIAYSTDFGKTANDGGKGENSHYTKSLSQHLQTEDLTIESVFKRTRNDVLIESNSTQSPVVSSYLIGDDIKLFPNDYSNNFKEIKRLIENNELVEAMVETEMILRLEKDNLLALKTKGLIYVKEEKYQDAINEFNKALNLDPENIDIYYNLGLMYHDMNDYEAALKNFNQCLNFNQDDAFYLYKTKIFEIYNGIGRIYLDLQQIDIARTNFKKALEINPESIGALHNLALIADPQTALDRFLDIKKIEKKKNSPDRWKTETSIGVLYAQQGDYNKSIEHFLNTIEILKEHSKFTSKTEELVYMLTDDVTGEPVRVNELAQAYANISFAHFLFEEYELALEEAKNAIDIDSKHVYAYFLAGISCQQLNSYRESIANFNQFIKYGAQHPELINNYLEKAKSHMALEEFSSAIESYSNAIEIDSTIASSYNSRGKAYNKIGATEYALVDYTHAIQLDSTNAEFYTNRIDIYREIMDSENLEKDYFKKIDLEGDNFHVYMDLGDYFGIALNLGDLDKKEKSIDYYTMAINLNKKNPKGYVARGNIYQYFLKDYKKAIDDYTLAFRYGLEPYVELGYIYEQLGDNKKALENYKNAIELDPANSQYHYNVASIYEKMKKNYQALQFLTTSIALYNDTNLDEKNNQNQHIKMPLEESVIFPKRKKTSLYEIVLKKANIYKELGEFELMCEDYQQVCELVNCREYPYKEIRTAIKENCK